MLSGVDPKDVQKLRTKADSLGLGKFQNSVTSRTTHLVVDGERRTLKVMNAICCGVWVVKKSWLQSAESMEELESDASAHEITHFVGAARSRRGDPSPLQGVGICIDGATHVPSQELQKLVKKMGGKIVPASRAKFIVGANNSARYHDNTKPFSVVTEVWLLDTIVQWKELDLSSYLRK